MCMLLDTHRECFSKVPREVALQKTCLAHTCGAQDDKFDITVATGGGKEVNLRKPWCSHYKSGIAS